MSSHQLKSIELNAEQEREQMQNDESFSQNCATNNSSAQQAPSNDASEFQGGHENQSYERECIRQQPSMFNRNLRMYDPLQVIVTMMELQRELEFSSPRKKFDSEETLEAFEARLKTSAKRKVILPSLPKEVKTMIDDGTRKQLRDKFTLLLKNHACESSSGCTLTELRSSMEHAIGCLRGPECSWHICNLLDENLQEHFGNCIDRLPDCTRCLHYVRFNEARLQALMKVVEKGCPFNKKDYPLVSELTREVIISAVTTYTVEYGLVGIFKDDNDTKEAELNDVADSSLNKINMDEGLEAR